MNEEGYSMGCEMTDTDSGDAATGKRPILTADQTEECHGGGFRRFDHKD